MSTTTGSDFKKIRNTFFWILLGWTVFNHTVRLVAPRLSAGDDLLSYGVVSAMKSLDRFRLAVGHGVSNADRLCPESARSYCGQGLDVLKGILGLK